MLFRAVALLAFIATPGCFYNPEGSVSQTDTTTDEVTTSASTPHATTTATGAPACGDGELDPGEACDDGNRTPGDGCEEDCSVTPSFQCGNGELDLDEQCDDGNTIDDDGCQSDCTKTPVCGDGTQAPGELCDDGNASDEDACLGGCVPATCGDGKVWAGNELCDDGVLNGAYGHCSDDCSGPGPSCGDQLRNGAEECDDGNLFDDDDCSNECLAPRIVFATAATYSGDLGGLDGADAKCLEAAQALALPPDVEWSAWLSDATADPATSDRFDTLYSGYYKLTTGEVVAHGWGELTTLPLQAAIGIDETGTPLDLPAPVWSNTFRNGTRIGADHCDSWTSSAVETLGRLGVAGATNTTWSDAPANNPADCSQLLHLYCFQRTAPL
ncbi:Myxococcus cysteine-rich repeat-containing protein [Nannocystis exedens]|uniref:Myxococcus cysteine-rich repeat-containing protein n=1 Tax=Nannocystis exedens TaxID=54 RepID=A0A1I2DK56_9BACT|nr:hypothetical protein NAEX_02110 [Nannocystis exedens]SFE80995.1 Myxococcus cysteine-rich repeat-containing protein [Nannocystis exedens]